MTPLHIKPPTSAMLAVRRLHAVIAADRQAVPCGRWVRIERPIRIPKLDGWLGIFPATRAPLWRTFKPVKPRYRYEVRR